jgi:REP element-mobilizing transposase RayT
MPSRLMSSEFVSGIKEKTPETMTLFKNKYRIESTRLKGWDYRNPGCYFVTICTKHREPHFGRVVNGGMVLSRVGEIAVYCWREIPHHHAGIKLDEFVIMPDHMHGIVVIRNPVVVVETVHAPSLGKPTMSEISPKAGSLGVILRSYKSAVTRLAGLDGFRRFAWQALYYDHIVRDEQSLCNIRQYIIDNPVRWEQDRKKSPGLYM